MRRLPSLIALCALAAAAGAAAEEQRVAFDIDEGLNLNSFLREGPVSAHLLLRSGSEPRILVAFPAGNSGVGLWFEKSAAPMAWKLTGAPKPFQSRDARGRALHGIEFEVEASAAELRLRGAVLSSVRVLRDYELLSKAPEEILVAPRLAGNGAVSWSRDRLDGAAGYRLIIEAVGNTSLTSERFSAAGQPLRLRIWALTGERPLQPLSPLLTPGANNDVRAANALGFLGYREKFLAGSWRFNTYFGRDTLISVLLLAPVLEPLAVESAISSVLDRLAPNGEVAHEEDIGEFAVLRNAREGRGRIDTPVHDYGMVDDDFLLAPLVARWMLDDSRGAARASNYLRQRSPSGETRGAALARNFRWVVDEAAAFAADPRAGHLIAIKPGRNTGNWRDSEQGLAGGRYPYDVNAAMVPAALQAVARLNDAGLLEDFLDEGARLRLSEAAAFARVWTDHAPALFNADLSASRARTGISEYAKAAGVDARQALRAQGRQSLRFHALSLDAQGKPVPVLHSDEGFRLLLTEPSPEELRRCLDAILRPFPAGLITGAGLLVANPAQAGVDIQREFSRFAYHGTVVWSWQQALLVAGLGQQLERADLPAESHAQLQLARRQIWELIDRTRELRTSELWSWGFHDGQYRVEPFGRPGADVDESNAAQLWSTVFLGLKPPSP
jgi:hypothetical protein